MDLIEFLRAWLDEDEAAALEVIQAPDAAYSAEWELPFSATIDLGDDTLHTNDQRVARHIARWDPARVLAEVEAKRRLIRPHGPGHMGEDTDGNPARMCRGHNAPTLYPCTTLLVLAQPAADHADFDPAWLTARA